MDVGIYTGENLAHLPSIKSQLVRVFISSTFHGKFPIKKKRMGQKLQILSDLISDYVLERNYLYEHVLPALRDRLLKEFGVDLTVRNELTKPALHRF